jgi:hypothetical protein
MLEDYTRRPIMKKNLILVIIAIIVFSSIPSHGFLNYLFSGGSSQDAVDNSAVGDLRAWWTGNPVYKFNPYHTGPVQPMPGASDQGGMQGQPMPSGGMASQYQQPTINFTPPQGAANPYGQTYQQPMQQMPYGNGQGYQQPMQQAANPYGQQAYQQPMQQSANPYYPQQVYQPPVQQAPQGYPAPNQGGYQYQQNFQQQY